MSASSKSSSRRNSPRRDAESALISFEQDQQQASSAADGERLGSPLFGRYLGIVLLLPLLLFLITFPLAASQAYLRISRRSWWHAEQYRFMQPPQQNCDVVIMGDSSGMTGVNPHVLEARTGWRTCNLALPYDNWAIAGTSPLDNYLAHNRPPRFVVFHLNENHLFRPLPNEDSSTIDAWLMVDEHFPLGEKLRLFASKPHNTLRFVTSVWKGFLTTKATLRPDWSGETYQHDMAGQIAERGWLAVPGTTPEIVCGWQSPKFSIDPAYLHAITAKYTRGETRAVIWANPARDCDIHIPQYRKDAEELGLPPTRVYNRTLFVDEFHLNPLGAARNATELATYLLSLPPGDQN